MREGGTFDSLLQLRASGSAAITSTTAETGISLKGKYFKAFKAVINIESIDNTTTDETYLIEVQVCATLGGTYETVNTLLSADLKAAIAASASGSYKFELPLSGKNINDTVTDSLFIRVKATLGGTTPILAYNAFLARNG